MVRAAVVQLLLFIAAVSVSTVFVGGVVTEAGLYSQAVGHESDRTTAALDAEIALIDDAEADSIYDDSNGTVTLYVKNVGAGPLEPSTAAVLLDGEYVRPSETRVLGADSDSGASRWRVETVLELTLDGQSLAAGEHRAVVDVETARDVLVFEVE